MGSNRNVNLNSIQTVFQNGTPWSFICSIISLNNWTKWIQNGGIWFEVGEEVYLQQYVRVEGECGDQVDDVDRCSDEITFVGADHEADADLQREPDVADEFDEEKGLMRLRPRLVQRPEGPVARTLNGDVAQHRHSKIRMRLQAKWKDRCADEEHGYHSDNLIKQIENINELI